MSYPTQHENFYKNQVIQLQQELEQLNETYQYRLNEAGGGVLARLIAATRASLVHGGESVLGATAHAAAEYYNSVMRAIMQMTPQQVDRLLRDRSGELLSIDLTLFNRIIGEYGLVRMDRSGNWQRYIPGGRVQVWVPSPNGGGTWINMPGKPGTQTLFGTMNGQGGIADDLMRADQHDLILSAPRPPVDAATWMYQHTNQGYYGLPDTGLLAGQRQA